MFPVVECWKETGFMNISKGVIMIRMQEVAAGVKVALTVCIYYKYVADLGFKCHIKVCNRRISGHKYICVVSK